MAYELPTLPYDYTALEPYISKRTLEFHHDKHHAAYVSKFNDAVKGNDLDDQPIEAVIKAIAGDSTKTGVFNNAAQAWNHTFYWNSMKPGAAVCLQGIWPRKSALILAALNSLRRPSRQRGLRSSAAAGPGWCFKMESSKSLKP